MPSEIMTDAHPRYVEHARRVAIVAGDLLTTYPLSQQEQVQLLRIARIDLERIGNIDIPASAAWLKAHLEQNRGGN